MPNPTPTQPNQNIGNNEIGKLGNSGPMVTVKKADGTMVKMPLSEVKNMRTTKTTKVRNEEITKLGNEEMRGTPNSERPPQTLAEGIERMLKEGKLINQGDVIKTSKQPASPATARPSLRSGSVAPISSAGRENTKNTKLGNEEIKGTPNSNWAADDHKSLLDDEFHKENLPMVIETRRQALAKISPVKQVWQNEAVAQRHKNTENKLAISRQSSAISNQKIEARTLAPESQSPKSKVQSPIKPMMHDVRPSAPSVEKRSLGPVDELRSFSLSDLRHLDVTPPAAGSKLLQKFETLKDESYLLYIEGVKAWRQSPLYREYQDVLFQALTSRQNVSQVIKSAKEREAMKMEEWGEVVKVNQSLV